jgi:hypothetical protein
MVLGLGQQLYLRFRLFQPNPHIHGPEHLRRGSEVLGRARSVARSPVEYREPQMAAGDEWPQAQSLRDMRRSNVQMTEDEEIEPCRRVCQEAVEELVAGRLEPSQGERMVSEISPNSSLTPRRAPPTIGIYFGPPTRSEEPFPHGPGRCEP